MPAETDAAQLCIPANPGVAWAAFPGASPYRLRKSLCASGAAPPYREELSLLTKEGRAAAIHTRPSGHNPIKWGAFSHLGSRGHSRGQRSPREWDPPSHLGTRCPFISPDPGAELRTSQLPGGQSPQGGGCPEKDRLPSGAPLHPAPQPVPRALPRVCGAPPRASLCPPRLWPPWQEVTLPAGEGRAPSRVRGARKATGWGCPSG